MTKVKQKTKEGIKGITLALLGSLVLLIVSFVMGYVTDVTIVMVVALGEFFILLILHKHVNKAYLAMTLSLTGSVLVASLGLSILNYTQSESGLVAQYYGSYRFSLYLNAENDNIVLNDLLFQYDFATRNGTMTFKVNGHYFTKNHISEIFLQYPRELNVTEVSLPGYNKENYSTKLEDGRISIYLYNISSNQAIPFLLELNSLDRFEPRGNFLFEANVWRVYNKEVFPFDKTIEFYLGDFDCEFPCIDTNPRFSVVKKEGKTLTVFMQQGYYDGLGDGTRPLTHNINLNMINKKVVNSIDNLRSFSTGLIAAGVILALEGIILHFANRFTAV